jgi:Tol biopolymer transport system component
MTPRHTFAAALVLALVMGCAEATPRMPSNDAAPSLTEPSPAGMRDVSTVERAALEAAPGAEPLPLEVLVPAEGTVIPWTFPAPDLQWRDGRQASLFRVRVRAAGEVRAELFTSERRLSLDAAAWQAIHTAAGEGGALDIELTGASVLPDGTVLRGPTTVIAHARFSGAGEHPSGHLQVGWKARPAGSNPGPVHADMRGVIPMTVAMDGTVEPMLMALPGVDEMRARFAERVGRQSASGMAGSMGPGQDGSGGPNPAGGPGGPGGSGGPGDPGGQGSGGGATAGPAPSEPPPLSPGDGAEAPSAAEVRSSEAEAFSMRSADFSSVTREKGRPAWASYPPPSNTTCVACHTLSGDGRYLAATSQEEAATPEGWVVTQGTLFVIRRSDDTIVRTMPGGLTPRFDRRDPTKLIYASSSNSSGIKQRMTFARSDIHLYDVEAETDRPVPGADDPERCEVFADLSPDGRTLAFSRSATRGACDGSRGMLDVATIPWNDGAGGEPTPLPGASGNGSSNLQPRFSPDGKWIVFYRSSRGYFSMGETDLWVVPATGGEAHRLEISTDALESWHAFSPDGHWLAFVSNRDRVDQPRAYLARFFDDGHTAPALPFPFAGGRFGHVHTLDWTP